MVTLPIETHFRLHLCAAILIIRIHRDARARMLTGLINRISVEERIDLGAIYTLHPAC